MQESAIKRMDTAELIRRTIHNLSDLVDKQVVLAGLELREDVTSIVRGAGILIFGLVSLFLMAIALLVAAILALSLLVPGWLAALIIALFFLIVGGVLIFIGRAQLQIRPLDRTRETIREDLEWATHRLTSNGK